MQAERGETKKQILQKHYSQDHSAVNKKKIGKKANIAQLKQLRTHLIRIAKKKPILQHPIVMSCLYIIQLLD